MRVFICAFLCLGLCICVFLFVEQRYRMIQYYLKGNSEYNMVGDDGDNGAARPNGKRCPSLIATPPDMRRIHGVSQSNNGKRKFSLRNANN